MRRRAMGFKKWKKDKTRHKTDDVTSIEVRAGVVRDGLRGIKATTRRQKQNKPRRHETTSVSPK